MGGAESHPQADSQAQRCVHAPGCTTWPATVQGRGDANPWPSICWAQGAGCQPTEKLTCGVHVVSKSGCVRRCPTFSPRESKTTRPSVSESCRPMPSDGIVVSGDMRRVLDGEDKAEQRVSCEGDSTGRRVGQGAWRRAAICPGQPTCPRLEVMAARG